MQTTSTNEPQSTAGNDSPAEQGGKRNRSAAVGIMVAFIFMMAFSFGYRVGKDLAHPDNHRDCVASGRTDCVRER